MNEFMQLVGELIIDRFEVSEIWMDQEETLK